MTLDYSEPGKGMIEMLDYVEGMLETATYDMDDCAALIAAAIQTETPDTSRTRCLASASGPPASTS